MGRWIPSSASPRSTGRGRTARQRSGVEDCPPEHRPGIALDTPEILQVVLQDEELRLFREIERRIQAGRFDVPRLPSPSLAVLGVMDDPSVGIPEIARILEADPILSSRLLRTANSVLFAGVEPAVSIEQVIMRLGLRNLRTMILSASVKDTLLRSRGLGRYAQEVWSQAMSVARIARVIAPHADMDRDAAFRLGLLHDVGKLPLLSMLDRYDRGRGRVSPALIGRVFHRFHEPMGRALAERWLLGDELAAVAGCHHRLGENTEHRRAAALCSLAHRLDLYLSLGDEQGVTALLGSEEMRCLGVPAEGRAALLQAAREAHGRRPPAAAAAQAA